MRFKDTNKKLLFMKKHLKSQMSQYNKVFYILAVSE